MQHTASRTAKQTRSRKRTKREPMTAGEARSFRHSLRSAEQILSAIACRAETGTYPECPCEPYEDVFTYDRWTAQDYHVRGGEKSLRLATWVPIEGTAPTEAGEDDDAPRQPRLKPHTAYCFCRCQVERNEPR